MKLASRATAIPESLQGNGGSREEKIHIAMPLAWLGLAYIPLAGAGLLAEWMYRGAELLANLPHAFVYALRPGWPALLLYYLLLAAALYCLARVKNAAWADEKI